MDPRLARRRHLRQAPPCRLLGAGLAGPPLARGEYHARCRRGPLRHRRHLQRAAAEDPALGGAGEPQRQPALRGPLARPHLVQPRRRDSSVRQRRAARRHLVRVLSLGGEPSRSMACYFGREPSSGGVITPPALCFAPAMALAEPPPAETARRTPDSPRGPGRPRRSAALRSRSI